MGYFSNGGSPESGCDVSDSGRVLGDCEHVPGGDREWCRVCLRAERGRLRQELADSRDNSRGYWDRYQSASAERDVARAEVERLRQAAEILEVATRGVYQDRDEAVGLLRRLHAYHRVGQVPYAGETWDAVKALLARVDAGGGA